jgi:hypothetical protein
VLVHTDAAGNWAEINTALQASTASIIRRRERDHTGASNHHAGVKFKDKEKHLDVTAQRRAQGEAPAAEAKRRTATRVLADMQDAAREVTRCDAQLRGLPADGAS